MGSIREIEPGVLRGFVKVRVCCRYYLRERPIASDEYLSPVIHSHQFLPSLAFPSQCDVGSRIEEFTESTLINATRAIREYVIHISTSIRKCQTQIIDKYGAPKEEAERV